MHPWGQAGGAYTAGGGRYSAGDLITAPSVTNRGGLDGWGFTNQATATFTDGGTGDINSAADVDPARIIGPASNTQVRGPRTIGDYASFLIAKKMLGQDPVTLWCEFYFRQRVESTGDGAIGLLAGAASEAAGIGAAPAPSFFAFSAGNYVNTAVVSDTEWHHARTETTISSAKLWLDGTLIHSQNQAIDRWPCYFGLRGDVALKAWDLAWYLWGWSV
jgi:hypothetical protein